MIREIHIKNFALIDDLSIVFSGGFSVFTGETGAGKSILVGAISLMLGERASLESIRSGSDEADVIGVFELPSISDDFAGILKDINIITEDNILIIRRNITKNGKNRAYLNQTPIPLTTLKTVGNFLVDLHGQHEHQSLLNSDAAYQILDSLPHVTGIKNDYNNVYDLYIKACSALVEFDKKSAGLSEKKDLIEYQYKELANLELKPDEEQTLENEYSLLSSATERTECISSINLIIEGDGRIEPVEKRIGLIRKNLETLSKYDTSFSEWASDIENVQAYLSELSVFCSSYLENSLASADPGRLDEINSRLAKIQRLKKKYHCSFNELVDKQHQLKKDLDSIENISMNRAGFSENIEKQLEICKKIGGKLSIARKKASSELNSQISILMVKLGINEGSWRTVFDPENEPTPYGLESVSFEVKTNPGEPYLPLVKTASGGEISRLMLAVKTVLAEKDHIPVLIFDEIDTGIGGLVAKEVADSLCQLSKNHQVICISHLHQIASKADNHFRVYKTFEKNRTVTRIQLLNKKEKIEEISRMLGSDSKITVKHAEELVNSQSGR